MVWKVLGVVLISIVYISGSCSQNFCGYVSYRVVYIAVMVWGISGGVLISEPMITERRWSPENQKFNVKLEIPEIHVVYAVLWWPPHLVPMIAERG